VAVALGASTVPVAAAPVKLINASEYALIFTLTCVHLNATSEALTLPRTAVNTYNRGNCGQYLLTNVTKSAKGPVVFRAMLAENRQYRILWDEAKHRWIVEPVR